MPLHVVDKSRAGAVPLNALKSHLRLVVSSTDEYTEEDNILQMYIRAATEEYEDTYKVSLVKKTLRYDFKAFSEKLELPRPPLIGVTSVVYYDADGAEHTVPVEDYEVVESLNPGYIRFHSGFDYGALDPRRSHPVQVTYTAGYGDEAGDVDVSIRLYLMNIIGTYYKSRESMLIGYGVNISVHDLRKNLAGLIKGKVKATRIA